MRSNELETKYNRMGLIWLHIDVANLWPICIFVNQLPIAYELPTNGNCIHTSIPLRTQRPQINDSGDISLRFAVSIVRPGMENNGGPFGAASAANIA